MNTAYYVNKIVGVAFGLGLVIAGSYQAVKWRNQMAEEAGRRMQERLKQIGEETMAELEKNGPQWDKIEMNGEMLKGIGGVIYPPIEGAK